MKRLIYDNHTSENLCQMRSLPKFNIRNCEDVVNAFLQVIQKKGTLTNSIKIDETPQNIMVCAIWHVKRILSIGGNIKSYMNQG